MLTAQDMPARADPRSSPAPVDYLGIGFDEEAEWFDLFGDF